MKKVLLIFIFLSAPVVSASVYASDSAYEIDLTGPITPVSANYVATSLHKAKAAGAEFMLIKIDTPGGLVSSMEKIVKLFLNSKLPTVCYVSPSGARAASAGTFILASCDIAAMAPATSIGAAHPVSLGFFGGKNRIMKEKITNYLSAMIRAIAEKRKRNAGFLMMAVKESKAITAREALANHVIDTIAQNQRQLLLWLNNRRIDINGKSVLLHTKKISILNGKMSAKEQFLHFLSYPTVSYLLFLVAAIGLFTELIHPGIILPGVTGIISLLLFLFSSSILPVNISGIALILLAFVLFGIDLFSSSHGVLSAGAAISLFIGSAMIIGSPEAPGLSVPIGLIAGITIGTSIFIVFAVSKMIAIHKKPPVTGFEGLIGASGVAITDISEKGVVMVHGERWNAVSENEIKAGASVVVVDILRKETTKLIVREEV